MWNMRTIQTIYTQFIHWASRNRETVLSTCTAHNEMWHQQAQRSNIFEHCLKIRSPMPSNGWEHFSQMYVCFELCVCENCVFLTNPAIHCWTASPEWECPVFNSRNVILSDSMNVPMYMAHAETYQNKHSFASTLSNGLIHRLWKWTWFTQKSLISPPPTQFPLKLIEQKLSGDELGMWFIQF